MTESILFGTYFFRAYFVFATWFIWIAKTLRVTLWPPDANSEREYITCVLNLEMHRGLKKGGFRALTRFRRSHWRAQRDALFPPGHLAGICISTSSYLSLPLFISLSPRVHVQRLLLSLNGGVESSLRAALSLGLTGSVAATRNIYPRKASERALPW